MDTSIFKIMKCWETSLERYGKLDNWKIDVYLSRLGDFLRNKECGKTLFNLIRDIRDMAIRPNYNAEVLLNKIKKALSLADKENQNPVLLMTKKHKGRVKKNGQEVRFKGETKRIFEERLNFKNGMLLRNFDIETESARESRKVRRIIEKRMCQAYHKKHRRSLEESPSNEERYWMQRATAYQLHNIGQVEKVRFVSRGKSTHWKRMFDPQTGEVVFKKKMAYSNLEDALTAIEKWKMDHPCDKREMHAYKCANCGKWHIGHSSTMFEIDGIGWAS